MRNIFEITKKALDTKQIFIKKLLEFKMVY
jgi:hypothetical protein